MVMVVRNPVVFKCGDITWDGNKVNGQKVEELGWRAALSCLTEALKSCEGDSRADPCTAWEEGMRDCAVCFAALGMGDIHSGFYELPVVVGTVPRSPEGCVLALKAHPSLIVVGGGANLRQAQGSSSRRG